MGLLKRFFYRKTPDHLLEITERVFVFDCCFSSDVLEADAYKTYMGGIIAQLQEHSPSSTLMVNNFKEDSEKPTQISELLPNYSIKLKEYPWEHEGCPVLPFKMINGFLNSSDSWLNSTGHKNVLLMHCERGGWPVLASMLAGLLVCRKKYKVEQNTLEVVYKQAPRDLLHVLSSLNPQPTHLRYLQYVGKKKLGLDWNPEEAPLVKDLDCLKLLCLPLIGAKGCRPIIRIYGHDPLSTASSKSSKLLFSTSKVKNHFRCYRLNECQQVKLDIRCRVEGDVVLECVHLHDDYVKEDLLFRLVFHVSFIGSNVLELSREEFDLRWDASDQMPQEFRGEVLFGDVDGSDGNISDEFFEVEDDDVENTSVLEDANNSAFEVVVEDVPGIVKDVVPEVKDVELKSVEEIKVCEGKEENEKVKKEEHPPQPQPEQPPPQNIPEQPPPQQPPNTQPELPQQPQAQPQQPPQPEPPQLESQQQPELPPPQQPPQAQDPPKPQPQESPQPPQSQEPPTPQPQESPQSQEPPQSQEQPKPQELPPPQAQAQQPQESPQPQLAEQPPQQP